MAWIQKKQLLHWFCPTRCACCSKVIYPDQVLCDRCRSALPRITPDHCPACGNTKKRCTCGKVKRTAIPCCSPFYYKGCIQQGLLTLKSGDTVHGVAYFAHAMAQEVQRCYAGGWDGIVYVPVTDAKLKKRGYNQSQLLARHLSKELGIPVIDNALIRLFDTSDQHKSPFHQRKGNVFGVFDADPKLVQDKHLLLVDDIITTGATIDECAKMLYLHDAAEVYGVTVASTIYNRE